MRDEIVILSRPVTNEQLVRQLDRKRHRELFMWALTGLALAAAVIAYAWPNFEMIRLGYRMEELRQERDELLEARRHLELQRATELSPARIEAIARDELGLVYPEPERVHRLEPVNPTTIVAPLPRTEPPSP